MNYKEVMNIRELAEYLGISPDSAYKLLGEETFPAFQLGNRWKFKKTLVDQWISEQCGKRD